MKDLNDLYLFAKVAEAGGFSAAGRMLGLPKSTLSRRIATLENLLDVRLIQRSSRRFALTDAGERYLRHCQVIVSEAEAADALLKGLQAEPGGILRISCPIILLQQVFTPLISRYLRHYPQVTLVVEATNRRVDVIAEGIDIALRVRALPLEDSDLVIRRLAPARGLLVGSHALLASHPPILTPADLTRLPSVDFTTPGGRHVWRLHHQSGEIQPITHHPRLITDEMMTLLRAVQDGIGIATLPHLLVRDMVCTGELAHLLPDWHTPEGILHAAFPSRRGLLPAVRRFLDFIALELAQQDAV